MTVLRAEVTGLALLACLMLLAAAAVGQADPCGGSFEGSYSQPVTVGVAAPSWQPHETGLESQDLAALERLTVTLSWTNGPTGGADFGIAVGGGDGFRYWNQEYQADVGVHAETRTWDQAEIQEAGWHQRERLSIGPSVSTGQFAAEGIPYEIGWEASYSVAGAGPCFQPSDDGVSEGPGRGDGPGEGPGGGAPADDKEGLPPLLLPGLIVLVAMVALLIALTTTKGRHPPDEKDG